MVLRDAFYIVAFFTTACVHLLWNDLVKGAIYLVLFCLSSPTSPILLSMLKLHCLVLASFVLAACFRTTSAAVLSQEKWSQNTLNHTLNFDDLATSNGFGRLGETYHHLIFNGLDPFRPEDKHFENLISPHDLNCAASSPNALYGTRLRPRYLVDKSSTKGIMPSISLNKTSTSKAGLAPFFALHALKVKPLDIPFSYTTLRITGFPANDDGKMLKWEVDFPHGFHDMLEVNLQDFSKENWQRLVRVEVTANFGHDNQDWEFCIDDMEVEFFTKKPALEDHYFSFADEEGAI